MKQLTDFIKESLNEKIKYCNIGAEKYFNIVFPEDVYGDLNDDAYRDDYDDDDYDYLGAERLDDLKNDIRDWFAKNTIFKKFAIYCDEDSFKNATSNRGYKGFFGKYEDKVNVVSPEEYEQIINNANLKELSSEYREEYNFDASDKGIEYRSGDRPYFFMEVI